MDVHERVENMPTGFIGRRFVARMRPTPISRCRGGGPSRSKTAATTLLQPRAGRPARRRRLADEPSRGRARVSVACSSPTSPPRTTSARRRRLRPQRGRRSQALENARLFARSWRPRQSETQRVGRLSPSRTSPIRRPPSRRAHRRLAVVNTVHRLARREAGADTPRERRPTRPESAAGVRPAAGILERLGPIAGFDWETAVWLSVRQPKSRRDVAVSGSATPACKCPRCGCSLLRSAAPDRRQRSHRHLLRRLAEPRRLRHEELSFAAAVAAQSVAG